MATTGPEDSVHFAIDRKRMATCSRIVPSKALSEQRAVVRRAARNPVEETERLGFTVLLAPDVTPDPDVMWAIASARDLESLNRAGSSSYLDPTVLTDNRPFFFNQLRFSRIPEVLQRMRNEELQGGVVTGNLHASTALVLILVIALVAVICAIVVPLSRTARSAKVH